MTTKKIALADLRRNWDLGDVAVECGVFLEWPCWSVAINSTIGVRPLVSDDPYISEYVLYIYRM
jgi:hypothetical protein